MSVFSSWEMLMSRVIAGGSGGRLSLETRRSMGGALGLDYTPASLEPLACACGRTVGPGCPYCPAGGARGSARGGAFEFAAADCAEVGDGAPVARGGYLRAAVLPAARAVFEAEEPMTMCNVLSCIRSCVYRRT